MILGISCSFWCSSCIVLYYQVILYRIFDGLSINWFSVLLCCLWVVTSQSAWAASDTRPSLSRSLIGGDWGNQTLLLADALRRCVSTAGWRIWTSVSTFPQLLCHLECLHLDPHHHDLCPPAGQCGHLPGQCQAHYLQGGWGEKHRWEYSYTSLLNR